MASAASAASAAQTHLAKAALTCISLIILIVNHGSLSAAAASCFKFKGRLDPCRKATCSNNAQCRPAINNDTMYQCVCINECWDVGDSDDSGPVCGTDGRDYESLCQLQKQSCLANVNVQVKYKGHCDPCSRHTCSPSQRCVLDADRKPYCTCSECLPGKMSPRYVCGTDSKTYRHQCQLEYESCRHNLIISKLHDGECQVGRHCQQRCPHRYMTCRVNPVTQISQCHCPEPCPPVLNPVCGSNSVVYDSLCHLRRAACLDNLEIWPLFWGDCGSSFGCHLAENRCPHGGLCRMRVLPDRVPSLHSGVSYNLQRLCERPECVVESFGYDSIDTRVCGSDGKIYKSECYLRQRAFDTNSTIKIASNGSCDACQGKKCPFYGFCDVNSAGKAECRCQNHCLYVYKPVCGSDGVTYDLECDLRSKACMKKLDIRVAHEGTCNSTDIANAEAADANAAVTTAAPDEDDSVLNHFWDGPP